MKNLGCLLSGGTTLAFIMSLLVILLLAGGAPFNPGPLSAAPSSNRSSAEYGSHADFESRCDLCHRPFAGAAAELCLDCHPEVRDQTTRRQGLHGRLPALPACTACHLDHQGRSVSMTIRAVANFPHNQFGFTLGRHQLDFSGSVMECRACHRWTTLDGATEKYSILAECVSCHTNHAAAWLTQHQRDVGGACTLCHDGTDRMQGFQHASVYPLTGQHTQVACLKCHGNNRFRGTPKNCVTCHADPVVHRGQFGLKCDACHLTSAWRPARLIQHPFPLTHGNQGKEVDCKVCHPSQYANYTCYGCHDHTAAAIAALHLKAKQPDYRACHQCHATGQKKE